MVRHYYKNAHAVVLVYDVTNAASFDSLKKWVEECNKNCLYDVPRILVGNKCDGVAAVTTNVAQRFADQFNMPVSCTDIRLQKNNFFFQLFETSARLDSQCDNVEGIFITLAHKLKSQKPFLPISDNIVINSNTLELPTRQWWQCC